MSWHYYARPKAPSQPPANIERLTALAKPLRVRPKFADVLAEEEQAYEKKKSASSIAPPPPPEVLDRLTKLPERYESRKGKFQEESARIYQNSVTLPPVRNVEHIENLSRPLKVTPKHVFVKHEPPPRPARNQHHNDSTASSSSSSLTENAGEHSADAGNDGGHESIHHQQPHQQQEEDSASNPTSSSTPTSSSSSSSELMGTEAPAYSEAASLSIGPGDDDPASASAAGGSGEQHAP